MKQPTILLAQQQREILETLGNQLQEIRTERGISIDAIAGKTLIPARLLKAIESGRIDLLPEPIYIRGFIQQYAYALDLDGAEFAQTFPAGLAADRSNQSTWQKKLDVLRPRAWHLYFLYIVLVFFAARGLSLKLEQAQLAPFNNLQPLTLKASHRFTSTADSGIPVVIDVTIKHPCYLKIVADEETVFEGPLPAGTRRQWRASTQLTLWTSNPTDVSVASISGPSQPETTRSALP